MSDQPTTQQVLLKLSPDEYRRATYLATKLEIGLSEFFRALIPNISLPEANVLRESNASSASPVDLIRLSPQFDRTRLNALLATLQATNCARALEKELRLQLVTAPVKGLAMPTFERLGRWCHPKRWTDREKIVQPIAHQISTVLFGKVIDRIR